MQTGVPAGFGRFVTTASLAIIIVGLVTSGSVMTPVGSPLSSGPTMVEARTVEGHSRGPSLREGVRADPVGIAAADDWEFFTQLASFLTCSHEWLAILSKLLGYGDTPLSTMVGTVDTCDPVSGLEAIRKVLRF